MKMNLNFLLLVSLILIAAKAFVGFEISWFWAFFPAMLWFGFFFFVVFITIILSVWTDNKFKFTKK